MNKYLLISLVAGMLAALSPGLFARGSDGRTDEGPSEVNQKNAGDTGEGGCPEGFRLFEHELLAGDPVCVPENPRRVASLPYTSYFYPFGVNLVGAWGLERDADNYPFIADWIFEGTTDIGWPPNPEVLIELGPDLMIFNSRHASDIRDELEAVGPLVVFESGRTTWQDMHRFNGAVLGQAELAEEQIETYEKRVREVRNVLNERLGDVGGTAISVVHMTGSGGLYLLGEGFAPVSVVNDIGFRLPDSIDKPFDRMNISEEKINEVDGDVLFVLGSVGGPKAQRAEGNRLFNEMMEKPIWRTLDVFRNNAIYFKSDYWLKSNILTAHMVIDELAEMFGVEMDTPNPFL